MISLNFPGLWLQWGKKEGINPSDLVVPILGHLWLGIQRMEVWSSWPHYQPLALGGSVCTVLERCCGKTSFHLHTLPKRLLPRLPFQPERVEGIMFSTCIKLCLLIPPVSPLCSLNSSVYEFFLAMRQGINKRWKTIKHLSNFPWQCCIKRRPCSSLPPLAKCSLFPPPLPTTMFPFRQQFHLHEPATLFHTQFEHSQQEACMYPQETNILLFAQLHPHLWLCPSLATLNNLLLSLVFTVLNAHKLLHIIV